MTRKHLIPVWIPAVAFVLCAIADARAVDYAKDVAPILEQHCIECHGPDEQESNLRLDRRAALLRGGDYGEPSIVPGKADESYLFQVVAGKNDELKMPPDADPLSADELAVLREWINAGAEMPAELSGEEEVELTHWSFQPIARVEPPASESDFVANGIDAFILRKLRENDLQPSQPAERLTKIRRLYFVMHGLPPTPEQIERYLADESSDAWEKVVDEVLASPRYGERWARHWLDLVRFGETHGFETNRERPNAWPYRDYVIEALNADKPYDEFVREQIAGDALGASIGTGFLVGGPYDVVKGNAELQAMQRQNELDDMINTTGTSFLGLTFGCARCHNHKFDPVTQADYYALQAVFAGVRHGDAPIPASEETAERIAALENEIAGLEKNLTRFLAKPSDGQLRPAVNARRNIDSFSPQPARFVRFTIEKSSGHQPCLDELEIFAGEENVALASRGAKATASGSLPGHEIHKLAHINDGKYGNAHSWICDKSTGWVQIELPEPVAVERIVWARDREGQYADRLAVGYRIEIATEPGQWTEVASSADRAGADKAKQPDQPKYDFASAPAKEAAQGRQWLARLGAARGELNRLNESKQAYVGTFSQPGPTHRLYRGEPDQKREVVGPGAVAALTSLELPQNAPEVERREALANWIASPDNPLTARVIVNRLWQHHLGAGIVDTPSDFGRNGTAPTHPELLDWLANELMANGWSLKHVHRLILTSNTWQQDSRPHEAGMAADASSRLLWRFPPRRMTAEAIRDNMLAVSGVLDLSMGGPGFNPFFVQKENVRHYFPKAEYGPEDWRRMIYMTKVRQEQESVFGAFDCPDGSQVAPKRSRSTTPLQAFNLFNSKFVLQQCDLYVERLKKLAPDDPTRRAALAIELAYGRPAEKGETSEALSFAEEHGWPALCRALFNANEFVFIP